MSTIYEADFQLIKNNVISFLRADSTFNSYNFEGSAINAVINPLVYLEEAATFYLNNTANEFFISQAVQTKNIYKNAKKLNYHPIRKSAGYIQVTFTSTVDMTVPIFEQFTISSNTLTLLENVTLDSSNSRTATVYLYEGEILTETIIVNTTELFSFTLDTTYSDIDNDNVYVYIDVLSGGSYPESTNLWTNSDNEVIETNTNSYFTTFTDTTYTIQFDNGRIFNTPNIDDRVRVKYLKTSGSSANGVGGSVSTTITNLTVNASTNVIQNGTDEESLASIKVHAPLFYQSQRRAVTEKDWFGVFNRYSKASIFKDKNIWGGENENVDSLLSDSIIESPDTYKNLGRVIYTTIKSDYSYLSTLEASELLAHLEKYKIAGLRLRFIDPNILTVTPTVSIKTSPSFSFSQAEFKVILNEYLDDFDFFKTSFYKPNLVKLVQEQNAILYSSVSLTTRMTVVNDDYKVIRIGSEITPSTISGVVGSLIFEDNGSGVILCNSAPVGTVNYLTGFITLTSAISTVDSYSFTFDLASDLYVNAVSETILKFEDVSVVALQKTL